MSLPLTLTTPITSITSSTSGTTWQWVDSEYIQVWPPAPVGCACRSANDDPHGCVPEYDMPGVGPVVPLEAYRAVVERGWRWRLRLLSERLGIGAHREVQA